MSELWNVEVLDRSEGAVRLRVTTAHPDAGVPQPSETFAIRLLAEANMRAGPRGGGGFSVEQMTNDAWVRRQATEVLDSLVVVDVRDAPLDEEEIFRRIGARLDEQGVPAGGERREALLQEGWRDWWQDPENLPAATYEIAVTDPAWIERLQPGAQFGSTAYP
jgi:hypothetical protein